MQQRLNDQWFANAIKGLPLIEFKRSMFNGISSQRAIQDCNGRTGIMLVGGNN